MLTEALCLYVWYIQQWCFWGLQKLQKAIFSSPIASSRGYQTMAKAFWFNLSCFGCCHWQANISRTPENLELHSPTFTWCVCERVPGTTGVSPIVCTESVGGGFCFPPIQVLALVSCLSVSHQTEHPLDFCFLFLKGKGKIFYFFKGKLYNSLKSGKKINLAVGLYIHHACCGFLFHRSLLLRTIAFISFLKSSFY